jgi:hypothetical protein
LRDLSLLAGEKRLGREEGDLGNCPLVIILPGLGFIRFPYRHPP